jgi:hypothetical protein
MQQNFALVFFNNTHHYFGQPFFSSHFWGILAETTDGRISSSSGSLSLDDLLSAWLGVSKVVDSVTEGNLAAALQATVQQESVDSKSKREKSKEASGGIGSSLHNICLGTSVHGSEGGLLGLWKDIVDVVASTSVLVIGAILEIGFASSKRHSVGVFAHVRGGIVAIVTRKAIILKNRSGRVWEGDTIERFIDTRLGKDGAAGIEEDSQFHRLSITGAVGPNVVPMNDETQDVSR